MEYTSKIQSTDEYLNSLIIALKKIKDCLFGSVLDTIECGNWWIPFSSYEYVDIKKHLETEAFHKFFKLPKSMKLSVKSFDTDMLSFERGH